MRRAELLGRVFGRLTVIAALPSMNGRARWECQCTCGQIHSARSSSLLNGSVKSCGCLRSYTSAIMSATHGHSRVGKKTSEYYCWLSMKTRCLNARDKAFVNYGARGIRICDRWIGSYPNFLNDMGYKPSPCHSLDRIDNNGNYEPSNCRWATPKEQVNNRRIRRIEQFSDVEIFGSGLL